MFGSAKFWRSVTGTRGWMKAGLKSLRVVAEIVCQLVDIHTGAKSFQDFGVPTRRYVRHPTQLDVAMRYFALRAPLAFEGAVIHSDRSGVRAPI